MIIKKFLIPILITLSLMPCPPSVVNAISGDYDTTNNCDLMSGSEIDNFIENAVPVPIPESSESVSGDVHNGSYCYDTALGKTDFIPFTKKDFTATSQSSAGYFPNGI